MPRFLKLACLLILTSGVSKSYGQSGESDLRIFGYFQNSFQHWSTEVTTPGHVAVRSARNFFSAQQLNLFVQKDLAKSWRAFINFEILNNFSHSRQWGTFNLEEAWVRYRYNERFTLKLGLQIPIFNHLNEIKNRTPVLPYVIRPLVYETSFSDFILDDEYIPKRAFVQAYGFLSSGATKLDYALYIGNSPNINSQIGFGPTGADTSATVLVGGRIGLRYMELKLGISGTFDQSNIFQGLQAFPAVGGPPDRFKERPRGRVGGDLSFHGGGFSLESEFIVVRYDDNVPILSIDREFLYGTLGYHITDQWFTYGSCWYLEEDDIDPDSQTMQLRRAEGKTLVYGGGVSYNLNERITFKGQMARINFKGAIPDLNLFRTSHFYHISSAVSVFF